MDELSMQAISQGEQPKKNLWAFIFLGILGVIVIALGILLIVFFLIRPSGVISDDELLAGTSVELGEDKEIKFKIGEEEHKITLDSIKESSVNLILQSEPANITLDIGETKKFDLDNNGRYDILIKLNNITDGKANLYVKEIDEIACEEDWSCDDWGVCINDTQTRACGDVR